VKKRLRYVLFWGHEIISNKANSMYVEL
jgi:hypothetical protein